MQLAVAVISAIVGILEAEQFFHVKCLALNYVPCKFEFPSGIWIAELCWKYKAIVAIQWLSELLCDDDEILKILDIFY